MPSKLKTNNVFLDTEVFHSYGLGFSSTLLGRLGNLGKLGKLNLLISDIISKEVSRHLAVQGAKLQAQAKEFSKQTRHFKEILEPGFKSDLDYFANGEISKTLELNWQSYIADSNIKVIGHDQVDISEIVDRYFNTTPPFAEGKKKKEFPDTISVLSLQTWLDCNDENAYVISRDHDLAKFCEQEPRCFYLKNLSELLDIYHWDNNDQSDLIHELIKQNRYDIKRLILHRFYDNEFTFHNYNDWEIMISKILAFNISSYDVISSNEDFVTIYGNLELKFSAHVEGLDWQNIFSESAARDLLPNQFTKNFLIGSSHDILFEMHFKKDSGDQVSIENITIDDDNKINLSAENLIEVAPARSTYFNYSDFTDDDDQAG